MSHSARGAVVRCGAASDRPRTAAGVSAIRLSGTDDPKLVVLALDLGGTYLRTAVVCGDEVSARRQARTPMTSRVEGVIDAAIQSLEECRRAHVDAGGRAPVAVGISAPGPLDPGAGVLIDPPNLDGGFRGLPLGPRIGEALGLPWALERDTNVGLLGEARHGAGRGHRDLVYLTVSTGIGGAVLSDGRLLGGADGMAGELGHMTIDHEGPPCGCGAPGHLERLASGTGIAASARDALRSSRPASELRRIAASLGRHPLEAIHVAEAAEAGDPDAISIIERARAAFAAAAVSIVNVFNPERIIVGGGIAIAWADALLEPARRAVASIAFRVPAARVRIVPAELGDDVCLIGAGPLVLEAAAVGPRQTH